MKMFRNQVSIKKLKFREKLIREKSSISRLLAIALDLTCIKLDIFEG